MASLNAMLLLRFPMITDHFVVVMVCAFPVIIVFVTPPQNRGEVIFSLQFVCVCVCVCVCPFVNKMPIEPLHRF